MLAMQSLFIDHLITEQKSVAIFLTNGIKLLGSIIAHDAQNVILTSSHSQQLIYKASISTILVDEALSDTYWHEEHASFAA